MYLKLFQSFVLSIKLLDREKVIWIGILKGLLRNFGRANQSGERYKEQRLKRDKKTEKLRKVA